MPSESSESVLRRFKEAWAAQQVIPYGEGMPDKQVPEVMWSQYGFVVTNEIVVIARVAGREFGIAAPSLLIYPFMIDRMFGIDIADQDLSHDLAHKLWPSVEEYLRSIKKI